MALHTSTPAATSAFTLLFPSNSMRTLSASLLPNLHWPSAGPESRPQKPTFLFGTTQRADWNQRGCQSRPFCPLRGASAKVGGLGEGKRGQFLGDFPRAKTLPPAPPSPTVYQNKRSSLTPPNAPGQGYKIHSVSFLFSLKKTTHEEGE